MTKEIVPLPNSFFCAPASQVAKSLLGRFLIHALPQGQLVGRIVETEAYDEGEPASHSFGGPTMRNRTMFALGGHAYVYRSYGIHWCLNVATGPVGVGAAVLIRALEPVEGINAMTATRRKTYAACTRRDLCRGPGRLCQAMAITKAHDGLMMNQEPLWLGTPADFRSPRVAATPRVGISKATDLPWRFCIVDNPFVSGKPIA